MFKVLEGAADWFGFRKRSLLTTAFLQRSVEGALGRSGRQWLGRGDRLGLARPGGSGLEDATDLGWNVVADGALGRSGRQWL